MYFHALTGGDDSGLTMPPCALCSIFSLCVLATVCKPYAHTHTHTQKLAQVHQQCMILLTHASDTPRLGDTGHYVNMILPESQVSLVPLGGGGAVEQYITT